MGAVPCVLERRLTLDLELSVVVARTRDGAVLTFPVAENEHRGGILAVSIVPARIDSDLAQRAQQAAVAVATAMNYVGVLCVEFFVVGGRLLANEIAPRPHNSGHYTIDACVSSQFDQQARVLAGQPLGDTGTHGPGGDAERAWRRLVRRRKPARTAMARSARSAGGEAAPVRQERSAARPQDGARHLRCGHARRKRLRALVRWPACWASQLPG